MKNKRERGEVVVEASIVVTLVTILITIMLYMGMVLYQKSLVSVMANNTASNLAQVYSNNLKDPFTGYVDPDHVYQSITYSNMKTDAYMDVIEQKANVFAQYRLKSSSILPAEALSVDVNIVNKPNEILKSQIVVTIKERMNVPLVGMFGVDGAVEFEASGRADCIDILEYLNGVEAVGDPENSAVQGIPEADVCLVTFFVDQYSNTFFDSVPVLRGETFVSSYHYTHSTMPSNPMNNGLKFKGWKTANGAPFSATIKVDGDMTVYGTWECTVTFDAAGGTVSPTTKTVSLMKTTTFPVPTRSGYAFEGWYTGKNGSGEKYESGITEISENITLYAKWRCLHASFTKTKIVTENCQRKSVWLHDCDTCDYSYKTQGDYGKCSPGEKITEVSPSCTSKGSYVVKCTVCKGVVAKGEISALGHRYASGNSGAYDQKYYREATCSRKGIDGSRCSRCGAEQGNELPLKAHVWDARCGVVHDVTHDPEVIAVHNTKYGYQYSTKVECCICIVCHAPRNGWSSKVDSNGLHFSNGRICREHTNRYISKGKYAYETAIDGDQYNDMPTVPVH